VSSATSRGGKRIAVPKVVPIVAAVGLLGTVGIVGAVGGLTKDDVQADGPSLTASLAGAAVTTTLAPTTTVPPKSTIAQPLRYGMSGPEVQALQQRLADIGFQPGPVDGQFGELTRMAVWAYQKLVMGVPFDKPDGIVTPDMWLALQDPLNVHARRPQAGFHTEVYLPQQVVVVFDGDTPKFISHMASGQLAPPGNDFTKGEQWCAEVTIDPGENGNVDGTEPIKKGVCGNAWTPGGSYTFYRKVEGKRESRLGGMLNPVYFNYGIAIHGAYQVPLHPASHGCIRIPNAISETFFNLVGLGQQVFVWDGVKEPETYGAQSGLWDWADPNYTTTTTTPPSTTSTTVKAATTTTKAPAVTPPATTTTVAAPPTAAPVVSPPPGP
jgi:hypothetical protein